jgi:hypothetical protein
MPNRINVTSKAMPKVVNTGKSSYRRIDPAEVAKSLGADEGPILKSEAGGSPAALFTLRQELYQRLRSTGGRRSLEGAGERKKIPLLDGDWEKLEEVAKAAKANGVQPTPAQVASMLIHRALKELKQDEESQQVSSASRKR